MPWQPHPVNEMEWFRTPSKLLSDLQSYQQEASSIMYHVSNNNLKVPYELVLTKTDGMSFPLKNILKMTKNRNCLLLLLVVLKILKASFQAYFPMPFNKVKDYCFYSKTRGASCFVVHISFFNGVTGTPGTGYVLYNRTFLAHFTMDIFLTLYRPAWRSHAYV